MAVKSHPGNKIACDASYNLYTGWIVCQISTHTKYQQRTNRAELSFDKEEDKSQTGNYPACSATDWVERGAGTGSGFGGI